ncbi:MAG: phosphatase PAP2 family protein [Pirellulales bacterium]|nr:phosphatase PAP2 family protein [Pirellulales bacterium]
MPSLLQPQLRRDASHVASLDLLPSRQPRGVTFQFGVPAMLAMLGVAAMAVDMPLARLIDSGFVPDEIKKLFDLAEVFAHGYGFLAILIAVSVLAPERRRGLVRIASGWVFAGVVANLLKMALARRRPLKLFDLNISVFQTFDGWLPLTSAGSAGQAFPSGHTTSAFALAVGLSWLIPRGKWLFASFAILAAMQRMVSGYHYLSDTLWGAALGWLCAAAVLPGGLLSRFFDRFDAPRFRQESLPSPHLAE